MNTSNTSNAKDVWDALANEMPDEVIIEMLVEEAISYLEYDDANPDVGMGMFHRTALQHAEKDVQLSAVRWKRNIHITDEIRKAALAEIAVKRKGR